MSDDLLEQLRTRHIKLGYELPTESLFSAAADEIEVLQDEVARLREALEGIMQWNNKLVLALPPEALPALAAARAALAEREEK